MSLFTVVKLKPKKIIFSLLLIISTVVSADQDDDFNPLVVSNQQTQKLSKTTHDASPDFGFNVSKSENSDDYIATFSVNIQATEEMRFSFDIDNTGYLEVGAGYGFVVSQFYIEPYVSYGKADNIDIKTLGSFAGIALTPKIILFADISHEWRDDTFLLDLPIFDLYSREWKNAIGASYSLTPSIETNYTLRHDRLLAGATNYKNDNVTSHELVASYQTKWLQPYVSYTYGPHRVTPGQPISAESSFEIGASVSF
ncbi:hypothetical protein SIN8267_01448 [Sinobacterium norvegicum]|uniref:Porin n=1 Tax=Sinobacterium norvegicum TaxID=1641715 RepID=A0ABN8EI42_9GAMM|nr:hypothetical protein [Sinobacterium norvegicum]CAH0991345.1 hypothetical protein SIN8267_01448 [Sinobacterium norvegicum]